MEDSYPEGAILLNLGCGDILWDGWVNVDSNPDGWTSGKKPDLIADITRLELPENHADAIAAIHVIEHFYQWQVEGILREWLRVLKPRGALILELPSMEKVFQYIANSLDQRLPLSATFSFLPIWGDPRFKSVEMMHKWGYFFATLRHELVRAGFDNIKLDKPRYHFRERDMRVTATKPLPLGAAT